MSDPAGWEGVAAAVKLMASDSPNPAALQIGRPLAKWAEEWCDLLKAVGATAPKVLPEGGDELSLTWLTPTHRHYLMIDKDGSAAVLSLARKALGPSPYIETKEN